MFVLYSNKMMADNSNANFGIYTGIGADDEISYCLFCEVIVNVQPLLMTHYVRITTDIPY